MDVHNWTGKKETSRYCGVFIANRRARDATLEITTGDLNKDSMKTILDKLDSEFIKQENGHQFYTYTEFGGKDGTIEFCSC